MLKKLMLCQCAFILFLNAPIVFAFGPGAVNAQIQNNKQYMQQHEKKMETLRKENENQLPQKNQQHQNQDKE